MKGKIILVTIICLILFALGFYLNYSSDEDKNKDAKSEKTVNKSDIQEGDIIFQVSLSSQSKAIQNATKSKYSHCGIIYSNKGKYYVYEAVQPVKLTPLDEWIARGKDKHYVIKRLKDADELLTTENLAKMKKEGEKFLGKNYDLTFEWSDDKIYCSELIWKIYKRAIGIEIGELQKLGDFDLSDAIVKQKLKERYGNSIPVNEKVISPASIYNSNLLKRIKSE